MTKEEILEIEDVKDRDTLLQLWESFEDVTEEEVEDAMIHAGKEIRQMMALLAGEGCPLSVVGQAMQSIQNPILLYYVKSSTAKAFLYFAEAMVKYEEKISQLTKGRIEFVDDTPEPPIQGEA